MQYTKMGKLAEKYWLEIPQHYPYVELGSWVIMPNHTHGILIINKSQNQKIDAKSQKIVETRFIASPQTEKAEKAPKAPKAPKTPGGITGNKNPMLNDNISRAIRWYKGRCTFEIRKIQKDFKWQPRFYDKIIRIHDHTAFNSIQNYIINNPLNWNNDRFYH